jgi:predicted aminopeptidase
VPAFARLFGEAKGDWSAFYALAKGLAELQKEERNRRLDALLTAAQATGK